MKQQYLLTWIILSLSILLVGNQTVSQDTKVGMDETMKKWMEAATPGEAHKKLNDLAGSWEFTSSMWMEGPDKPPTTSKGTTELHWILDGRFLQQEMQGEMMGMPLHGMGFNGYDNLNKKYTMFWIDNSGTAMYLAEGNFDKSGKVLSMYGKMDDAITGERDKTAIYILRLIDKDQWIFEFHDPSFYPETKVGEMIYTRKK